MPEPFNIPRYEYIGTYGPGDICDKILETALGHDTTSGEAAAMAGLGTVAGAKAASFLGATLAGTAITYIGTGLTVAAGTCETIEFVGNLQEEVPCEIALQLYVGGDKTQKHNIPNASILDPSHPVAASSYLNQDSVLVVPVCKDGSVISVDTIIRVAKPYVNELVNEVDKNVDPAVETVDDLATDLEERLEDTLGAEIDGKPHESDWAL